MNPGKQGNKTQASRQLEEIFQSLCFKDKALNWLDVTRGMRNTIPFFRGDLNCLFSRSSGRIFCHISLSSSRFCIVLLPYGKWRNSQQDIGHVRCGIFEIGDLKRTITITFPSEALFYRIQHQQCYMWRRLHIRLDPSKHICGRARESECESESMKAVWRILFS